jgi:toxin ParE1/3/4
MSRCRFTFQAADDLEETHDFIPEDSPQAAVDFISRLEEKCHILAKTPEMGRQRNELAPSLRSFPEGKYLIFYQIKGGIEIIRVLHSARDIVGLQGRVTAVRSEMSFHQHLRFSSV